LGVVLTVLAYLPALDAGFVFDDKPNILDPPGVHWTALTWEGARDLLTYTMIPRRVVANFTFALNHLVGGLDPWGYHLVNVLIHVAVGLALVWLAWVYVRLAAGVGRSTLGMVWVVVVPVVLFLVHPLNTQAVTYVVQRMALLAALFSVLALAAYLVGRGRGEWRRGVPWYVGALVLWVLALGSKENALILPLVVATYEACFHGVEWRRWVGRWWAVAPSHRLLRVGGGVVLLGVVLALAVVYVGGDAVGLLQQWPDRGFNGLERVLTQGRVQVFYLGLLLWPVPGRLNLDHDFAVSRGLFDPPTTVLALLFWLVVVVGVVVLARRRPLYGFPLLAYLEWHLIEAGPVNLELVFEHRMYLPLTMLVLLGAAFLVQLKGRPQAITVGLSLALALPLAWGTWVRNRTWADPIAFHYDVARKSPNKFRPQYNLGTELMRVGRLEDAIGPIRRAVEIAPEDARGHNQLGNVYLQLGRPEEALAEYRAAWALDPEFFEPVYNVGRALEAQSAEDAAEYYYGAGTARGMAGKSHEAIALLERAVQLDTTSSQAHNQLGNAYLLAGRTSKAVAEYRRAVALDDRNAEAVYNLGMVLDDQGMIAEAVSYYLRFLEIAPPRLSDAVEKVRRRLTLPGVPDTTSRSRGLRDRDSS
jgi:Flp pilus assembly protein TadD